MEKLVWWRSGALHVNVKSSWNWSAKPEVGPKEKQIPVAIQPLVKMVWLIQDLWSCSSFDLRTLNTCRNRHGEQKRNPSRIRTLWVRTQG